MKKLIPLLLLLAASSFALTTNESRGVIYYKYGNGISLLDGQISATRSDVTSSPLMTYTNDETVIEYSASEVNETLGSVAGKLDSDGSNVSTNLTALKDNIGITALETTVDAWENPTNGITQGAGDLRWADIGLTNIITQTVVDTPDEVPSGSAILDAFTEYAIDPDEFVQVGQTNTVYLTPYFIGNATNMIIDTGVLTDTGSYIAGTLLTPLSPTQQNVYYLVPKNAISYDINGFFLDPSPSTTTGSRILVYLGQVDYGSTNQATYATPTEVNATNLSFNITGNFSTETEESDVVWLRVRNCHPSAPMDTHGTFYLHPVTAQIVMEAGE